MGEWESGGKVKSSLLKLRDGKILLNSAVSGKKPRGEGRVVL